MFNKDYYNFIENNKNIDPINLRLALKKENFNFDINSAIVQIECRKKYSTKLKQILEYPEFIFPDVLSGEQASHQAVARYHSSFLHEESSVFDMTAGLGIDSIYFTKSGANVTAIDLNHEKAKTLGLNAKSLNLNNLAVTAGDSISYLKNHNGVYDLIFIDPARRDLNNNRVYNLHDCSPDVLVYQDLILSKASRVLIKASPLLDITQTIKDFKNIKSIHTVGVKGECKEVLVEISKEPNSIISLIAINLNNDGKIISRFTVEYPYLSSNLVTYLDETDLKPGTFILEPSAMIMKLSPWQDICRRFKAKKFGKNSHLFLTDNLPENFPGRVTKFEKIIKKQDRKLLTKVPATIVSRNYPLSADEIRKTFHLLEGDNSFIYATRIENKPIMLLSKS